MYPSFSTYQSLGLPINIYLIPLSLLGMVYYLYYPDFTHKDEGQGYCMA